MTPKSGMQSSQTLPSPSGPPFLPPFRAASHFKEGSQHPRYWREPRENFFNCRVSAEPGGGIVVEFKFSGL